VNRLACGGDQVACGNWLNLAAFYHPPFVRHQSRARGIQVALTRAMPEVKTAPDTVSPGDGGQPAGPSSSAAVGGSPSRKNAAKNRVLIYIAAALAVAAVGLYFALHSGASASASGAGEAETTFALDTFVVNLDGAGQRAYLRVGITLGLSRTLNRKKEDLPVARLRDVILSVLSSARPEQLLASGGKQKLKADLLQALQEQMPGLGIENVYFTEFLVQM